MKKIVLSLLGLTAAFLLTPQLRASDGRIPIAPAAVYPVNITAPGHYYLTADISAAVNSNPLILISASDVTLDLNGHTLSNNGSTNSYGVQIAANQNRVTLRNGRISQGQYPVYYYSNVAGGAGNFLFEDLTIEDLPFAGDGIYLYATTAPVQNVMVRNCRIASNGSTIFLYYVNGGRIENNVLRNAGTVGNNITLNYIGNIVISGNVVTGGGTGILASFFSATFAGLRIAENTIYSATTGVYLVNTNGCQLYRNVVTGSAGGAGTTGIYLNNSADNTLSDNTVSNTATGLFITGAASTGNIYSGNRLSGNTTPTSIVVGNQSGGGNCTGAACS
jgi:parallel beta-helix repeat protein